jgi:hypothetical protein
MCVIIVVIAGVARPSGSFVKTGAKLEGTGERLEVTVVIFAVIAETAAGMCATTGKTGAGFVKAESQL